MLLSRVELQFDGSTTDSGVETVFYVVVTRLETLSDEETLFSKQGTVNIDGSQPSATVEHVARRETVKNAGVVPALSLTSTAAGGNCS